MTPRGNQGDTCAVPLVGIMWIIAIAFGSALAFALAFPPVGWGVLAPIGYLGIVVLATQQRLTWLAVGALLLSATGLWLWFQWWLIQVAAFGYPILALFMASYWVLALWLLRRCRISAIGRHLPWAVLAPIVLVACEWLRGTVVMDGYPWFLIGQAWIDLPMAELADVGGVPLVTALVAAITGAIVDLAFGKKWPMIAALALVAVATMYGWHRQSEAASHRSNGPTILVYQPNLPVSNVVPWPKERQEQDVAQFARETVALFDESVVAGRRVDLVVWPETILPGFGLEPDTLAMLERGGWWPGGRFAALAKALVARTDSPLLVGSAVHLGLRPESDRWVWDTHFNSAYLLGTDGTQQRYDKLFLTPFGETMPYISHWDWLEEKLLDVSAVGMTFDLDEGSTAHTLRLEFGDGPEDKECEIATPICFEDTVPAVVRSLVYDPEGAKRADVIVNVSNDGWFGSSDSGREQHALMARWRCIELRIPMVRAANTGVSAAYDSHGQPIDGASLAAQTSGGFAADCSFDDRLTIYGRTGDVLSPIMLALTAILVAGSYRPRRGLSHVAALVVLAGGAAALIPGCASGGEPSGTLANASSSGSPWSSRQPKPDPSVIRASPTTAPSDELEAIAPTIRPPAVVVDTTPPTSPVLAPAQGSLIAPATDPVPAVAVVNPTPTPITVPAVPEGSDPESRAVAILLKASESDQPIYRVHALEGLEYRPDVLTPVVRRLLADENPGVRFAAAVLVGKRHLSECADVVEPLTHDPDASVRAAALYALVCLGRIVDLNPLAELLMSVDPRTRSNALFVLGELRNPSAIALIESVIGRRLDVDDPRRVRIVDLQAAEALVKMGDYRQYDPIRAALFAPSEDSEIVALACQMVGEVEDRGARGHLIGIWNAKGPMERPIEVRLIAGASLARIGEPNLDPIFQLCATAVKDPSPGVRAQAVATLGWAGGSRALVAIEPLLADPVPMVRLTAAAAQLRAAR